MKYSKIIILFFAFGLPLFSQVNSPYSRYGIGELEFSYSARRAGMGGLGVAMDDNAFISMLNPAAWHSINLSRIEFATYFNGSFVKDQNQKSFYSGGYFSGFSFALPVSKENGIIVSMGLIPLSKIAYETKVKVINPNTQTEDYSFDYSGEGGLSKVYFGASYTLPFDVSLGATLDYNFGTFSYNSKLNFPNSTTANSSFISEYRVKGLGGTFGLISQNLIENLFKSEKIQDFRLGAAVSFLSKMSADTSFTKIGSYVNDTLSQGITSMNIPLKVTFGASARLNPRTQIYADYLFQNWADYSVSENRDINLQNLSKVSLGIEYKNSAQAYTLSDLIIWRGGVSYGTTPYKINGTSIKEFSVSAGVSLPFSRENYLDLSLQYISRGSTEAGLLKENILKLGASLSLGELWFVRQDY
ncbi:MAG: hypothetical protein COT22_11300 [Ignavibacteria bacterium CG08_land_8_20_14_0_20_37_9]|nr:hypothetical protein [Ignavibacteria bacterium]OIO18990.1 MAG: hypothetical protein AUJ54_07030 [Ignavibacteria bacterium CG1_02_37_35]PIS44289.1 MAG: hypothetical protein COT22_11300 [Ignavibacteria bacterium CG08_land_8_20_14_0_20_37_9]PIX93043.1 MAG: hypothetical protein COZ25_12685 [Ignavibacteria bacterium CG_4_10_14_3_um_filter_37_18]